jgi:hypothetical protein
VARLEPILAEEDTEEGRERRSSGSSSGRGQTGPGNWGRNLLSGSPGGRMVGSPRGIEALSPGWKSRISEALICSRLISVFSPVCVLICCCSTTEFAYFLWQTGHWGKERMGGLERCTPMWVFRLPFVVKVRLQILHLNGRSPVWMR